MGDVEILRLKGISWKSYDLIRAWMDTLDERAVSQIIGMVAPMTGLPWQLKRWMEDYERLKEWSRVNIEGVVAYHQPHPGFPSQVRNGFCKDFLQKGLGEWVFFMDTDMTFPQDTLARMLASRDEIEESGEQCDVLTGLYFKKWPPFEPLAFYIDDRNEFVSKVEYGEQPCEIDACGGGCLLIKREVIHRIVFELRVAPFGWMGALHNRPEVWWMERMAKEFTTEDFPFNLRCRELGFKTWLDPRIKLGHIVLGEVTEQDFLPHREKLVEDRLTQDKVRVAPEAGGIPNPHVDPRQE
jgi:hypothetical protein